MTFFQTKPFIPDDIVNLLTSKQLNSTSRVMLIKIIDEIVTKIKILR